MAMVDGVEFTFDGPEDARAYRNEVGRLWGAWVVGMGALFLTSAPWVLAAGVVVIATLLALARPLQRRAEVIVPDDATASSDAADPMSGRRTQRERVLRALAHGEAPLQEAMTVAGASGAWLVARRLVLGLTVVGFAGVLVQVVL